VKHVLSALLGAATLLGSAPSIAQTTLTIATVNNGDMIRMQGLSNEFTAKNPDVTVKWVTLEENVLRQRVTTDIATKGGQFDVLTIGTYEVPIWAKKNWLIHGIIPSFSTLVFLFEKLDLSGIPTADLIFLYILYFSNYSKMEQLENRIYHRMI